jgi:hypothetical protein
VSWGLEDDFPVLAWAILKVYVGAHPGSFKKINSAKNIIESPKTEMHGNNRR